MKKLILAMVIISIPIAVIQAQSVTKKTIFSIGIEAGVPVGTAGINDIYSFAIGGSLQGEYLVSPDFGLTLKAGYLNYLGKNGIKGDGLIPILAGFRYHFTPKVYGSAQLGISLSTVSGGGSAFTYAPGIGFQLSKNVDVLARYEAAANNGVTVGNIGVRLAYSFN
jgi:hypothetical protein